jgi:hypothetical protein
LKQQHGQPNQTDEERLFLSLSEQLRHVFLLITRFAERAGSMPPEVQTAQWQAVRDVSESAMFLTEAYAESGKLQHRLTSPEIEPVTVSALLYDAAERLRPLARQYDVELALDEVPRLTPVMSDRYILQAALTSLGQVFVLAQAEAENHMPLMFAAHRTRYGIVAGVYTEDSELTAEAFRKGRMLYGRSSQPLGKLVSGPATGVFVADALLQSISAKLHLARYHGRVGLGVTLPICDQLQLV